MFQRIAPHHPVLAPASLALALTGACGGGDLDRDTVTNLPAGDATGTALSGAYELTSLTRDCEGSCAAEVGGFVYSACDIGYRDEGDATIAQADGELVIESDDSDYISLLEGGVYADGSFDVGGIRTHQGGAVEILVRIEGRFAADTLTGEAIATVRGAGEYDGEEWSVDCRARADVEGGRR